MKVVFLETDPKRSRTAEEAGFAVVFGDPLEERTMLRAQPTLVSVPHSEQSEDQTVSAPELEPLMNASDVKSTVVRAPVRLPRQLRRIRLQNLVRLS